MHRFLCYSQDLNYIYFKIPNTTLMSTLFFSIPLQQNKWQNSSFKSSRWHLPTPIHSSHSYKAVMLFSCWILKTHCFSIKTQSQNVDFNLTREYRSVVNRVRSGLTPLSLDSEQVSPQYVYVLLIVSKKSFLQLNKNSMALMRSIDRKDEGEHNRGKTFFFFIFRKSDFMFENQ